MLVLNHHHCKYFEWTLLMIYGVRMVYYGIKYVTKENETEKQKETRKIEDEGEWRDTQRERMSGGTYLVRCEW